MSTRGAEVSAMMTGRIRSQFGAQPDYPPSAVAESGVHDLSRSRFFVAGDTWDTFSKLFMHGKKTFLHAD
jgi:hypothetical protein